MVKVVKVMRNTIDTDFGQQSYPTFFTARCSICGCPTVFCIDDEYLSKDSLVCIVCANKNKL